MSATPLEEAQDMLVRALDPARAFLSRDEASEPGPDEDLLLRVESVDGLPSQAR